MTKPADLIYQFRDAIRQICGTEFADNTVITHEGRHYYAMMPPNSPYYPPNPMRKKDIEYQIAHLLLDVKIREKDLS